MKKYNVFKILLIAILSTIVISLLIPSSTVGYYSSGIEKGTINPINLVDTISNGLTSFSVFISSFVYILCIGIFYTVLKKTGKYDEVITNTASKFKDKKSLFIAISVLTLGLLTAIVGDIMPMLIFVPAFLAIARKLGYDSKTSILTTIGAIILGSTGSLYTNNINQLMQATTSSNIIAKIAVLLVSLVTLILFIHFSKKPKNVTLKSKDVKKGLPLVIVFDVLMLLILLGMIPWNGYFGFEGFSNLHTTITEFKIFDVSLFNAIIGSTLSAFGEWTIYTVSVLILFSSAIIALIYKIKVDDMLESIAKGVRVALPYGVIIVLSNIVLVGVYNSGLFTTIIASVSEMTDKILSGTTLSLLSSLVYPDYAYATQFTLGTMTYAIANASVYLVIGFIFQVIYSLFLLISPTSVLILMGLHYEGVNYKDWIKYIYKYFLGLLIILFTIIMIVGRSYLSILSFVVLAILIVILVLFIVLSNNKKEEEKKQVKKNTKNKSETKKSTTKKPNNKK